MKTILLCLLSVLFASNYLVCPNECDFIKNYKDFITIKKEVYNGQEYISKKIVKPANKSCYSDAVSKNLMYFDYLLTNFSSSLHYNQLLEINDESKLNDKYISLLSNDENFNPIMEQYSDIVLKKTTPKDTVTFDEILNIAVKFFSITHISDEGAYVAKICAGINDIKKTEELRKPHIEAFCFSSILDNIRNRKYNIYKEFLNSAKELHKVNLGVDKNERLLRAQGALYFLMRNNNDLINILKDEYSNRKEYLTFVIVDLNNI